MATAHVPMLFKGAGPGTHWHRNDPKQSGFTASPMACGHNALLRHITNYSHPSPYLSFSTSFAIAKGYAMVGPGGLATPAAPGYVYEIDLSAVTTAIQVINPVADICLGSNGNLVHAHNGGGTLIAELADGLDPPTSAPQTGGGMLTPAVSKELRALIFAIRDAEVLITVNIPPGAIVNRHLVHN